MILRRLTAVVVVFAVAGTASIIWVPRAASVEKPADKVAPPTTTSAASAAGRFQIAAIGGEFCVLDTVTGQVWNHLRSAARETPISSRRRSKTLTIRNRPIRASR